MPPDHDDFSRWSHHGFGPGMSHHDPMMYHQAFPLIMPSIIIPLILLMFVVILITQALSSSASHSSDAIESQGAQSSNQIYEQGYRPIQPPQELQADLPEIGQDYDYARPQYEQPQVEYPQG